MNDREKVVKALHCCAHTDGANCIYCPYDIRDTDCTALMSMDILALLKEQEPMTPEEFKDGLLKMFSSIWECEIDHPMFQDTVGELMDGVMQLYKKAVKWNG